MTHETITGEQLIQELSDGTLASDRLVLTGVVKASDREGHLAFSQTGPSGWVDIPGSLIAEAERVGMCPCPGESHPIMHLTFVDATDEVSSVYRSLLAQLFANSRGGNAGRHTGGSTMETVTPGSMAYGPTTPSRRDPAMPIQSQAVLGMPTARSSPPTQSTAAAFRSQFYPPWQGAYPSPWGGFPGDLWGWDSTLPSCSWELVVCGSSPPGIDPPECWIYCCRWPNGHHNCRIV